MCDCLTDLDRLGQRGVEERDAVREVLVDVDVLAQQVPHARRLGDEVRHLGWVVLGVECEVLLGCMGGVGWASLRIAIP